MDGCCGGNAHGVLETREGVEVCVGLALGSGAEECERWGVEDF